jgi:glycosyltransferase involved in cell wall biosynthesis
MVQRTVLFVIDSLDVGGAQELLVLLARYAAPRYRVVVCALQTGRGVVDRLEAAGAEVRVLGRARPSIARPCRFLAYFLGGLGDILRLCAGLRPHVIHCHLSDAVFLGVAASLFAGGSRVIITKHTPVLFPERRPFDPRNVLRKAVLWLTYRRAAAIAAVSEQTRRALLATFGLSPGRVVTIINGVPIPPDGAPRPLALRAGLGLAPDDVAVVNVGRLVPVKGQIHLVRAMAGLAGRHPRLKLFIAGEGPCREELTRAIEEHSLAGRVRLLGDRSDVAALWAAADMAVVSSLSEGTSLALIEAMAAGRPIVATAVGGNLDLLADGQSALLVPSGDAGALGAAIGRLADDPALGERLGRTARDQAKAHYGVDRVVAAYAALWEGTS